MHLLQLLKGWLLIVLILTALFFLGMAMERRYQKARLNPHAAAMGADAGGNGSEKAGKMESQPEMDTLTGEKASQDADSLPAEEDSQKETVSDEMVEAPEIQPALQDPEAQPSKGEDQNTVPSSQPGNLPETTELNSAESAKLQPEATRFEPLVPKKADSATPTVSVRQEGPGSESIVGLAAPIANPCHPFPKLKDAEGRATEVLEDRSMLAWRNTPAHSVSAILGGTLVRIHQNPYHGLTAYIVSEDGAYCLVYGRLDSLLPGRVPGATLACGEPFAKASAKSIEPHLVVEVLALAPGQAWWQGTPMEPAQAFPQWLPLEPEAVEEDL